MSNNHQTEAERMAMEVQRGYFDSDTIHCNDLHKLVLHIIPLASLLAARDELAEVKKDRDTIRDHHNELQCSFNSLTETINSLRADNADKERKLKLVGYYGDNGKEIQDLLADNARLKTELAYANDAAEKGEEGRKLGTALEECQEDNARLARENALLRYSISKIQNPYPESVFPMTETEYVKFIPDPANRTAVSGFLMRRGWLVFQRQLNEVIAAI